MTIETDLNPWRLATTCSGLGSTPFTSPTQWMEARCFSREYGGNPLASNSLIEALHGFYSFTELSGEYHADLLFAAEDTQVALKGIRNTIEMVDRLCPEWRRNHDILDSDLWYGSYRNDPLLVEAVDRLLEESSGTVEGLTNFSRVYKGNPFAVENLIRTLYGARNTQKDISSVGEGGLRGYIPYEEGAKYFDSVGSTILTIDELFPEWREATDQPANPLASGENYKPNSHAIDLVDRIRRPLVEMREEDVWEYERTFGQ